MADTLKTTTLMNTKRKLVVMMNLSSDGTGTTDGVVVDKSTFTGLNGLEPTKFAIEKIDYQVSGMTCTLEFDHTTDDVIANLVDSGYIDFTDKGAQGFVDPASAGGTGDIVVTTVGHSAGDTASIVLTLRKKD